MNPDPAGGGQLELRPIHLPGADWWPPAIGWWIVALLVAIFLWFAIPWLIHRIRRYRRERAVLRGFQEVRMRLEQSPDTETVAEASAYIKRVALACYPPEKVAALSGRNWLSFLDATSGGNQFSRGPGEVLGTAAYRPAGDTQLDGSALGELLNAWIRRQLRSGKFAR